MVGELEKIEGLPWSPCADDGASLRRVSCGDPLWRLHRAERNPKRAEVGRARFLRCICEDVAPPGDLELIESSGCNCSGELCFQQSSGDSTRPKVDFSLCALRYRALHQDIGNLQTATGS